MILQTMLARLHASLARGPGLNARPHRSRQRIDLCELAHFQSAAVDTALRSLLGPPARALEFAAKAPAFKRPEYSENEWSDEQKAAAAAVDRQGKLLLKLRDIATDATDYFNDHGEDALFLGFPLLSLPASGDAQDAFRQKALLAPVMLLPLTLRVRLGPRQGITLEPRGDGADLLVPNPALLAWIEQQTGSNTDELFADESGEDPWRELGEVLALVGRAAGLPEADLTFTPETALKPVPRADQMPDGPRLLPSAVLGLFPLTNPGLLRDTKWMMEHEPDLKNPAKAFISPVVLEVPAENEEPAPAPVMTEPVGPNEDRLLVTHADPCQAAAVDHARQSDALVIHGPPGTGKSQTIANIIGDHLGRGERVLFVCDKRTALDVVKFRLDGMGLGKLCGVIHDPQHDRRDLYLGLRERLEALTESAPPADPGGDLSRVTQRLEALRAELRAAFDALHAANGPGPSFHDLVGRWMELTDQQIATLPGSEQMPPEALDQHRTDAEEIMRRSRHARWPENPYRGRLGISLGEWLALEPKAVETRLQEAEPLAAQADALQTPDLPLAPAHPLDEQAQARNELADTLARIEARGEPALSTAFAAGLPPADVERWNSLRPDGQLLEQPLERELALSIGNPLPSLGQVNQHLSALTTWEGQGGGLSRWFAFAEKKAASQALAPLGLPRQPAAVSRAIAFYRGLRARWLWSDWRGQKLGQTELTLATDAELLKWRDGFVEFQRLHDQLNQPPLATVAEAVRSSLRDATTPTLGQRLRQSAEHAHALQRLLAQLNRTSLFRQESLQADLERWMHDQAAQPLVRDWIRALPTLEDAVRLTERCATLPEVLNQSLLEAAQLGLDWPDTERAIRAGALAGEIRRRLRSDQNLARIDTDRVEAAFAELAERTEERQARVRASILHRWDQKMRERLVATGGQRLNSQAAALRTRLLVRGKRALKLRPMIAAGLHLPGGDPLFDLCPIWMASPATVAQIFPREPLFDVIIFDEASQCRLEEALPVLLRGRRVVVAGDPKQLPPTRFFETGLAESDDTAADTAEEVFVQQQSEAEDLLTAALNLDVQQAYLDVHYRSRNEALIGFSNDAFYGSRLQPVPGHPRNRALRVPIRLVRVDGVYSERGNPAEAKAAADLVAELLEQPEPPSIGIACFNLPQRDLILDALDERMQQDRTFAERLEAARQRRGRDSFEGLFVKNLENVQGDERDHMIICTTFGTDKAGKFRRNFGALSRQGGERRLNVLVTRAREAVHVLTSIPRQEYLATEAEGADAPRTGRHQLYSYLRYAERLAQRYEEWQTQLETARRDTEPQRVVAPAETPSAVATSLGQRLFREHRIGSTVHWGNAGFCIDLTLTHPELPEDVTIGVLTDFNRYRRTRDPIAWELFRTRVLRGQGWTLHRLWTPALFRDRERQIKAVLADHQKHVTPSSSSDVVT
jgi:hypothetical protein